MSTAVFRHHVGGIKLKLSTLDGGEQAVSRPHHLYSGGAMANWHVHKGKYLTAAFRKLSHCHLLRKGKR
jgi:hypothetical protein